MTPRTGAEGPGFRFAVWAQGCAIRCPGCFNPHFWRADGGRAVTADDLARQAIQAAEDGAIEGVTLLGGEPFEQAGGFASFASSVRAAGLSVMVFTGHEREHLEGYDAPPGSAALLAATLVAILLATLLVLAVEVVGLILVSRIVLISHGKILRLVVGTTAGRCGSWGKPAASQAVPRH